MEAGNVGRPGADMTAPEWDVRFTPESGQEADDF
jgi:hypothetical protein